MGVKLVSGFVPCRYFGLYLEKNNSNYSGGHGEHPLRGIGVSPVKFPFPYFSFWLSSYKIIRIKMNENSTLTPTAEQLEKLAEWLRRSGRPQSADTLLRRYIEILKETNNAK